MSITGRLAAVLIAFVFIGCRATLSTSAASPAEGALPGNSVAAFGAATLSSGARTENVPDPTLNNMTAYSVTIPSNWKFQGVLLQGGIPTCESLAFPVWRAVSSDGRSRVEELPQMLWAWGTGPLPRNGCLPFKGAATAQQLLRTVAGTMQLDYVRDVPVPAADNARAQQSVGPNTVREIAWADVHSLDGTAASQGRLQAMVDCTERDFAGMRSMLRGMADRPATQVHKCTATVIYFAAPDGQLAAMMHKWDAPGMGFHNNVEWGNAWVKRAAMQGNALNGQIIKGAEDRFAAQQREIAHTMAVQQQMHDQFLATMEEGTRESIDRTAIAREARSTAASDMVDYSLDRQTVLDTSSGRLYKITNQVTVGGDLQQVHGNGTPY